ncbi:MAG: D-2-hydroxyacid dehydrogenase family protein [Deltaproteobacteria bacterium]|nr:D-2-hydroxyacid dehydrogenase family protein [Deltaproteobacteria bacterium]
MTEARQERFRVLILDDYEGLAESVPEIERLRVKAHATVMRTRLGTEEELAQALRGVHAILLMRERTRFGERQMALGPDLKLISQTGRGIAHLDLPAATQLGIAVAVTPNDSGISTVELTFGLIFALLRHIPQIDRKMRDEPWPAIPGTLLERKTVGVVGLGRIGRQVACICQAFKAHVLATGRTLTDERAREVGANRASLEVLLKEADIVTIHAPLNPETRALIGEKELSLMKPGAILINTSRGPIVSEQALLRALETGHLGGAGLDVFDQEPLPMEHPFRTLNNVVLLSHRGYATVEILRERFQLAMANILSFLENKPINILNPQVLAPNQDP